MHARDRVCKNCVAFRFVKSVVKRFKRKRDGREFFVIFRYTPISFSINFSLLAIHVFNVLHNFSFCFAHSRQSSMNLLFRTIFFNDYFRTVQHDVFDIDFFCLDNVPRFFFCHLRISENVSVRLNAQRCCCVFQLHFETKCLIIS
jgi:hypothetical protein